MLNAILIDDEEHCLDTLSLTLMEHCPDVSILAKCGSAAEGVDAIQRLPPDVVFLDIEMPSMNGFEMLERLPRVTFAVIFTTGYDQFAIKAIRFSALDYLLKPVEPGELVAAVQKISNRKELPGAEQFQILMNRIQQRESGFNKVALPTATGYELVPVNQIIRCEADDNYTHIFLSDKRRITACRTLKEVEEQLQDFRSFVRVHHSFMVNLNEVVRYVRGEGGYLVMSDGASVNVSRNRKDTLMKLMAVGR